MIEIRELSRENFKDFIFLLGQRGKVTSAFYEWKYINTPNPLIPSGYIAYKGDEPVGCIGKINKNIVDEQGNMLSATWFADWFILEKARGTGSGKALMQQVANSAKVGMGIPGPAHAQVVAAKAGYKALQAFVEVRIPFNPWRVGFKKYPGPFFTKAMRGVKEMINAAGSISASKFTGELQTGFPPADIWLKAIGQGLCNKIHFERSYACIKWFSCMPVENQMDRQWWYYESAEMFLTGFTETDRTGLRRSKVIELITLENDEVRTIQQAIVLLKKSASDLMILLLPQSGVEAFKLPSQWQLPISLHITHGAKKAPEYLSLMDKESSWIDFTGV